ncbi:CLUMA_CG016281, isoform A [Clunio marinus]|uniref:CLUMA_CG016281, isoform A n=1 Tax=Clunio marinus TaxID=568069 RepID=A0A1J1IUR8_9DIPT|nr:CLUMA_CG016281, isoform A [Clunio marinus]
MVGETKKRSKNASTSSSTPQTPVKLIKEEVFSNAIEFEEKEESKFNRDQFKTCFTELNKLIQEVSDLKSKNTEEAKKKIVEKRIQGSLIIVKLKKLNRLDKIRLANRRELLAKEKLNVDSNRLKLQNLIYEADHLKKEINKCISFKSEDEDIKLVSMEEFLKIAPEESRTPEILEDKHALRMARLEFELQQRKEYAKQCKELEKEKEEVAEKIVALKDNLDSLLPNLQNVCKATRPIQKILNMPFEIEWEIQKIVRLLPQPLYMAYTKLLAYSEVIDNNLSVSVDGNEDEALQLENERKQGKDEKELDENEDSENEAEENDFEESDNRRKVQRRQSRIESQNQKRQKLFAHHPLSVQFQLKSKKRKETLSVTLNYLPDMSIVTVQGKFNLDNAQSVAAGDIMTPDRILSGLYEGDYGMESPSPHTSYQLQNVQLNPKDLSKLLDEKMLGKPYKWAQRLCGISVTSKLNIDESFKLCDETVPQLIRQMHKRVSARMKLYHQIQSLEIGKITISGNVRISSILQQFVSLSFAEYSVIPCTKRFIESEIVGANDLFYRAVVTRGSAKLECYIAVRDNFPIFALQLSYDNKYNAENSSHIREIEGFVNGIKCDSVDNVLSLQLQRAMTSLDIFLETESFQHQDGEFHQEKNFSCSFRGRGRSRPYQPKVVGCTTSFKHIGY